MVTTSPAAPAIDIVVVGAGQAGLSAASALAHRGLEPYERIRVLDADAQPGGAWQHRWSTLPMAQVHGVHQLPGLETPGFDPTAQAADAIPRYFAEYEHHFELPVLRPPRVDAGAMQFAPVKTT